MTKPNVIVFFTDQQRWDTTGVHGNPLDLTPNFDRMARKGTDIHYSFTVQPVCGPARSCLQTGLYATETGSFRNGIPLSQEHKTLAHHFKEGGYQIGYIGKWHLAPNEYEGAIPEEWRGGYDHWLAANLLEFVSDAYDTHLFNYDNEDIKLPGYRVVTQRLLILTSIKITLSSYLSPILNRIIKIIGMIILHRRAMQNAIVDSGFRLI
jgi:arylsulfatase A-like enzyme